ncbi:MAG: SpoIID/LytB domain-containing protein [Chloroflexota bacterium]
MKYKNILLMAFLLALLVSQPAQAAATVTPDEKSVPGNATPANLELYNMFYVKMYKLVPPTEDNSGAILPIPNNICVYPDDFGTYGCGSEYPDTDIREPEGFFHVTEQYYLRNVLPNEMDFAEIAPDIEALKAQAIAARTVANWKSAHQPEIVITRPDGVFFNVINNSTQFQVFIPGTYNDYQFYISKVEHCKKQPWPIPDIWCNVLEDQKSSANLIEGYLQIIP